ncbi:site-specific DNA-methyltransferase [Bradyrhizobium sp. NBAIM08]|uniref:site-specific DNA-methyltransferase n=1 Tax=Bradyrhizobium sp. NBAIM08 TaxID=2793815 RepID=UPI001CD3645E|nr:site-specific DNA-methyltransferase [Bradyrhizobium sp. NBAIM08]
MHLIITSPPYNIGKAYEKRTTNELYIEQQAATIAEAVRLLHPRGSICWQVGNGIEDGEVFPLDILLYPKFKDHGLKLRNRIVWTFGHGLHCQKRLSGRHETILWFTKSDDYTFNLDPIRVPSKYPLKKHFKGPNKGKVSSNPLMGTTADMPWPRVLEAIREFGGRSVQQSLKFRFRPTGEATARVATFVRELKEARQKRDKLVLEITPEEIEAKLVENSCRQNAGIRQASSKTALEAKRGDRIALRGRGR